MKFQIEQVKDDRFEPFDVTIKVDSKEVLASLWHRTNVNEVVSDGHKRNLGVGDASAAQLFYALEDIVESRGLLPYVQDFGVVDGIQK